jgi:hypothetical protein
MNLPRAIEQGVDSFRQYFSSHQKPPMFPFQVVIVFKIGLIHSVGGGCISGFTCFAEPVCKTTEIYPPLAVEITQYLMVGM